MKLINKKYSVKIIVFKLRIALWQEQKTTSDQIFQSNATKYEPSYALVKL